MDLEAKVKELRKRLEEALEYIRKGDAVQASEKLYKVAENAVKLLAQVNGLPEYKKAVKDGGWWIKLLDRAARKLRDIYGEEVFEAWSTAYRFHQKGFHEEQLTIGDVSEEAYKIEDLVKIVEKELGIS